MSLVLTLTDQWSDGKRVHVIGTLAFSSTYAAGGDTLDLGTAGVLTTESPLLVLVPLYRGYSFEYVAGTAALDGKLKVYGSGNAAASGVLTSDNTNVANNATVTIGTRTYTFKTSLTASTTANEVLIGADADGSLTNLARAINGTGTPGTDYGSLTTVNTDVSSGAVSSHTITVTALVSGTAGNAIASTETSAHLSWGAATLAGGVNQSANGSEMTDGAAYPTDLKSFAVPFYAILRQLA